VLTIDEVYHGMPVEFEYDGTQWRGHISKEGERFFLCSDCIALSGLECLDKICHEYSWAMDSGDEDPDIRPAPLYSTDELTDGLAVRVILMGAYTIGNIKSFGGEWYLLNNTTGNTPPMIGGVWCYAIHLDDDWLESTFTIPALNTQPTPSIISNTAPQTPQTEEPRPKQDHVLALDIAIKQLEHNKEKAPDLSDDIDLAIKSIKELL